MLPESKWQFLADIVEWFIEIKAPMLAEPVQDAVLAFACDYTFSQTQKKLLGFMLFTYSMNKGPNTFVVVQDLALEIGVDNEVKEYAKDWIEYSKNNSPKK